MITVKIDELTPCLKDGETGELIETEVVRIKKKSILTKFNKKNGWYTSWNKLIENHEIYALVVKGNLEIQGLIAIQKQQELQAIYIAWMVVHPNNNKQFVNKPKYKGVGGHLFAIAIDISLQYGFGGAVYGFAKSEDILQHYIRTFDAEYIGVLHQYQFWISENNAQKIKENYTYEFTNIEL